MTIPYIQIILLIVAAISIAACAPVSTSTSLSPTLVLGTPTGLPTASPSPQPTYAATAMPTSQPVTGETQIRVIIGDTVLTGRLLDNATARDLILDALTSQTDDFTARIELAK